MNALVETMARTIAEYQLLEAGDRLLVAVSGGPDSLALLHALWTNRQQFALADVQAAHLDHGLRGADAAADAAFVHDWCAQAGIGCTLGKADVAAIRIRDRQGTQEAARQARCAFLEDTARRVGADKIATGHTQDDQVETVLMNILRGAGLDGLRGIPYRRGPYVRPLRNAPRSEVSDYCAANALRPRLDPSNLDASHYARNRVRLELLPLLEQDYHPGTRASLLRLSENAARDADFLHVQAQAALETVTLGQTPQSLTLDARLLRALHPALLRHVLRAAFGRMRGSTVGMTQEHWEPLCEALAGRRRLPFGLTTPAPHCAARVTLRRLTLK